MPALQAQSASNNSSSKTFIPSSHESQRSPLTANEHDWILNISKAIPKNIVIIYRVKKQATACLAKWWIQPSSLNCVIIASIYKYQTSEIVYEIKVFWIHSDLSRIQIYPWISSLTLSPFSQSFWILIPRNLNTNWIAFHSIELAIFCRGTIKELSPQ